MTRSTILILVLCMTYPASGADMGIASPSADDAAEGIAFFEKRIRPLLIKHCFKCHSSEGKVKGGLNLETRESARAGGESGAAIMPGSLENSLLIEVVRYKNADLHMPPKGKLSDQAIADLERWVRMGAPDPREGKAPRPNSVNRDIAKVAASLWSLKPLARVPVPAVKQKDWPRSDIDRFTLAEMEKAGLTPVEDAHVHWLIRRLYMTLIGLQPSAERMRIIVNAYQKQGPRIIEVLVDQMLASPRFGEKWGRHWLDLARYADTNVGSFHPKLTNAWLYRNHVIKRFNEDMPFDQFITEQIAGDLLPAKDDAQRADQIIATGFLGISVRDVSERDGYQIILDGVDDQLDTIGKSLLGLSIGCARCHDHKFDPISTADYYAMAGIHHSSATTYLDLDTSIFNGTKVTTVRAKTAKWMLPGRDELEAQVAREFSKKQLSAGNRIGDLKVHIAGSYRNLGHVVPRGFIKAINVPDVDVMPRDQSGRLQFAQWLTSKHNPLPPRVMANRVWYWLFGRGLVESVDDFGTAGTPPSHPALLDWLALRLRDHHGWRLKPLIREIVLSRTWQLGAWNDAEQYKADPGNRYHWRWRRQRLSAEQLHDSLLMMAGDLNLTQPGQTRPDYKNGNTFNASKLKIPKKTMQHRAVYLPVFRKDVPLDLDVLTLFNFPDSKFSTGRRFSNTVPSQALFLWNSPRLHDTSMKMGRQLLKKTSSDDVARAKYLTLWIYSIPGQAQGHRRLVEMKQAVQLLYEKQGKTDAELHAWKRVIHTMLISNGFLFVN